MGEVTKWTAPDGRQHIAALDGLRAFAVFAVLCGHCLDGVPWLGKLGVQLFFTLSGFLITRMLLQARGTGPRGTGAPLRNFFVRRALRLWPAYYATLTASLVFDWTGVRASALWHLTYLTNVYLYIHDTWEPWVVGHFWSLDVEEHFYLVWPAVIYLVRRDALARVIVWTVALAWLGNLAAGWLGYDGEEVGVEALLPFALVNLAAGGLLGLGAVQRSAWLDRVPVFAAAAAVAWLLWGAFGGSLIDPLVEPLQSTVWLGLVHHAASGRAGLATRVLTLRPLVYVGSISYGIYLFHPFVMGLISYHLLPGLRLGPTMLLTTSVLSVAAAALSWHLFEKPLNAQKRHFPFGAEAVRVVATAHSSGTR